MKKSKVEVVWVQADEMLADCLTKRGGQTDGLMDVITLGILVSSKKYKDNEAGVHMVDINKDENDEYETE